MLTWAPGFDLPPRPYYHAQRKSRGLATRIAGKVKLSSIRSLVRWPQARQQIEAAVRGIIGGLPESHPDLQVKVVDEDSFRTYVRRRISYFVDDWARASAWLFTPETQDSVPALLCCHAMIGEGKAEPAGLAGDPALAFARHYAERGYVTLAPDCVTAGERVSVGLAPYDTAQMYKDFPGMSAAGKMLADHKTALDLLSEARHVDPARIGVVGHGLGGFNALLLAAFDDRVRACVSSCGFTRFSDDDFADRWARDDGFVYMPELRPFIESGEFPFDWEHVLAMAAPTPILLLTALNDPELAKTKSCAKAVKAARHVYGLLGEERALEEIAHSDGRRLTPAMLDQADEWFERWL